MEKRICNEPLGAGVLAQSFLDKILSHEQKDVIVLVQNKAKILPGKLQEKVEITSLSKETLILKTTSSVWRAETLAAKNNIIAACNKILGKIAVKTIKIG